MHCHPRWVTYSSLGELSQGELFSRWAQNPKPFTLHISLGEVHPRYARSLRQETPKHNFPPFEPYQSSDFDRNRSQMHEIQSYMLIQY